MLTPTCRGKHLVKGSPTTRFLAAARNDIYGGFLIHHTSLLLGPLVPLPWLPRPSVDVPGLTVGVLVKGGYADGKTPYLITLHHYFNIPV